MSLLVQYQGSLRAVLEDERRLGQRVLTLAGPPSRLYAQAHETPPRIESFVDVRRAQPWPTPAELLSTGFENESVTKHSSRSQARLGVFFLLCEDPQRRLEANPSASLLHQMSLVEHVLKSPHLRRVLIADEVGLGKTIEAGRIIKRLRENNPGLRVLYLAPARLVPNVGKEFAEKLDLLYETRLYRAQENNARIGDPLVIASMQKAVHPSNFQSFIDGPPPDVLIVDECHRLTDFDPDGGHGNRGYQFVKELLKKQGPAGRLILMSGTPHQGNPVRFENLLKLLLDRNERLADLSGRVIYRTKDKIVGWNNERLFPRREVLDPRVVSLGPAYVKWYNEVGDLYDEAGRDGAGARATGWAKGQALQWVASSVQAGLAFLVRLAIRRLNWDLKNAAMEIAVAALRPYRNGSSDQPVTELYQQLRKQTDINQSLGEDRPEDEEDDADQWRPNKDAMARLLKDGVKLLASDAATEKWHVLHKILRDSGDEKVVLFAQPVETVNAVAQFLKATFHQEPTVIIGAQSEQERGAAIESFWRKDGPRFLVSSRAGGEGINLQCARRLVHLDVPWNPMEMEQRVGRVHRFGSTRTIIVETLVVKGSREEDAYRIAREKLEYIVTQMLGSVSKEEFAALFSRVMSVIPPEELAGIVGAGPSGPLTAAAVQEIGNLVRAGFDRWNAFSEKFKHEQESIRALDPGAATWLDLRDFLVNFGNAKPRPDVFHDIVIPDDTDGDGKSQETLPAVTVGETTFVCGDLGGLPIKSGDAENVRQAGTNISPLNELLRKLALPDAPAGAACLKAGGALEASAGYLVFARQTIRREGDKFGEQDLKMVAYKVVGDGSPQEISAAERPNLIRALVTATAHRGPIDVAMAERLRNHETLIGKELLAISDADAEANLLHAAWPVFAAVITS